VGAFGALLKAALASSADDPCDAIIQQTAAVGIMYMSTMVRIPAGRSRSLLRQVHCMCTDGKWLATPVKLHNVLLFSVVEI
jgi:hypothetical protein